MDWGKGLKLPVAEEPEILLGGGGLCVMRVYHVASIQSIPCRARYCAPTEETDGAIGDPIVTSRRDADLRVEWSGVWRRQAGWVK